MFDFGHLLSVQAANIFLYIQIYCFEWKIKVVGKSNFFSSSSDFTIMIVDKQGS